MVDIEPQALADGFTVTDLRFLVDRGLKFGTIYADPPWQYDCNPRGGASRHYRTMPLSNIAAMPVADLSAENAHLHLWTTHSFLFDAKKVMDDWGFQYKEIYVWCKPHRQMGTGYYWRSAVEILLLGVKGKATFPDRTIPNWLQHKRLAHSQKPQAIRTLIERVSPGPYLELFGRRAVHDWVVFGDEVSKGLFDGNVTLIGEDSGEPSEDTA